MTDEDGAVFALIENGRMLVKAPNVKHYRIPDMMATTGQLWMDDYGFIYSADCNRKWGTSETPGSRWGKAGSEAGKTIFMAWKYISKA